MRYLLLTSLCAAPFLGCGNTTTRVVAPNTPVAPNTTSPQSTAIAALPSAAAPAAVTLVTDARPRAPKHECTVFVMGDPKNAFKATVQDKQFKQQETTSTEISMYAKVVQGDEMSRIALCDAFAKRKCPEAWHGDDTHCRMQMTVDVEAEWGSATQVPK